MCKMCNTNREPYIFKKNTVRTNRRSQSLAEIFSDAVYDYTGERPCKWCCNNIGKKSYDRHGIDFMIIKKLFSIATKGRKKEVRAGSPTIASKLEIIALRNIGKNIRPIY